MRQILKSVSAFAMGASAGLIFEFYFPPEAEKTGSIAMLILLVSFGGLIALHCPEIRQWWWLRRTPLIRIVNPLCITHILDLHEFLADEEGNPARYRLVADRNDKARPVVNAGDRIVVSGKQQERMQGGFNTLVQCRIRVLPSQ